MRRVISNLEQHLLDPAGLQRIGVIIQGTDLTNQVVVKAIQSGNVQAVKILHLWYMKQEWLQPLQQPADTVQLNSVATLAAAQIFRRRYPERMITRRNRTYIHLGDVALVEEIIASRTADRKHMPAPPGYVCIMDLDCSAKEGNALRHKKYSDGIIQRGRTYVPEAEVRAYLEQYRARGRS